MTSKKKSDYNIKGKIKPISTVKKTNSSSQPGTHAPNSHISPNSRKKIGKSKLKLGITLASIGLILILAVILYLINVSKDKDATNLHSDNKTTNIISNQTKGNINISDIKISNITKYSITATWKTNLPATSELQASVLGSSTTYASWPDETLVLKHEATVNYLSHSTAHKLKVVSMDASGKRAEVEIEKPYTTLTPSITDIGISVGDPSPDFLLKTINGKNTSLIDYSGKWVMLAFWDLSCSTCREELPYIETFYRNFNSENITLITINVNGTANLIDPYIKSLKYTFPVLLDTNGAVAEKYTIATFPATFLIDPNGIIKKIKEGAFKNDKEISDFIGSSIKTN